MKNKDVFEFALRSKLRFPSTKGPLSLEQLWEVPLRSSDDFNLNSTAKAVNKELSTAVEDNFVDGTRKTAAQTRTETMLSIVKYVIETKLEEETEAKDRANRKVEREKLLTQLAKRQDAKLDDMSEAAIKKKLAEMDDQ